MNESGKNLKADWDDDDLPEWTDNQFDRAEIRFGKKLIRPADGTLTRPGRPKSDSPKKQVTLRLDPDVIKGFKAKGKGWQTRINEALRKALGI